jgi:DNA-binding transcriptional LysR family regulator
MLDRFTSMQVFLALVRRGTFAAAADEVGVSRAMASKHIRALEARLGLRLFNRTTRRTRLTEAGERYFRQVDTLLADLDSIEARLGEEAASVRGLLTLAAPPAYGAFVLAPIVAAFMSTYPEISVCMTLADRPVDLVDEGIDVAITVRDLTDSSNVARRLSAVRLIVCGAPAYLVRHGTPHRPEDLTRHNCLPYAEAGAHLHTDWQFLYNGETFDIRVQGNFVSNVGNALRNLAVSGVGLVRLPDYIVATDLASGALVELLADFAPPLRPVYALYPHREHLPRKVLSFLDFAAQAFAINAD